MISFAPNVKDEEIDLWLEKTTALEESIKGLVDGKINPEDVSLRKYGILTPNEKIEEDLRKEKARKDRCKRRAENKTLERKEEIKRWWDRAKNMRVLDESKCDTSKNKDQATSHRKAPNMNNISVRYSSDYSRWSNSNYIPDDIASRQEDEEKKKIMEKKETEKFEKANSKWCEQFKQDAKIREDEQKRRKNEASELRMKGNTLFKSRQYESCLNAYYRALDLDPFAVNILLNIALTYEKLGQFELTLEFCNRVISISSQCTKAFFLRHKAFVEMKQSEAALKDLEICTSIDPQNKEVIKASENIIMMIESDKVENLVYVVKSSLMKKRQIERSKNYKINIQEARIVIPKTNFGVENQNIVQRQCELMDDFMTYFIGCPETVLDKVLRVDFINILSIEHIFFRQENQNLMNEFVQKLFMCKIARTYMRVSGHLHCICESLFVAQEKLSSIQSKEPFHEGKIADVIYYFYLLINGCISEEIRSKSIVAKRGLVDSMISLTNLPFNKNTVNWRTVKIKILACQLLLSFLNDKHISINSLFRNNSNLRRMIRVPHIVFDEIIMETNDLDVHHQVLGIKICSNLLSAIYKRKPKAAYDNELNPVTILMKVLNHVSQRKKFDVEIEEKKKAIIGTLLDLSANESVSLGLWFCSNTRRSIANLFIIIENYKHQSLVASEMTLTLLNNIIIRIFSDEKIGNSSQEITKLFNDIQDTTNLSTIVEMCCLSNTKQVSNIMRSRAASLLDNLDSLHQDHGTTKRLILLEKNIPKLASNLLNIIVSGSFSRIQSSLSEIDLDAYAGLITSLVRIMAKHANEMNKWLLLNPNAIKDFICLFPLPRNDTNGVITKVTVCQKPILPPEGTPHHKISTKSSFYGNLLKIIIIHLNSFGKNDGILILQQNFAIERLVCLLANSNSFHSSTTKNASIVLAQLMKSNDPLVTRRCRELRGIQMIMQLNKNGAIGT